MQLRKTTDDLIPEGTRRALALIFLWGGWLGDLFLLVWISSNYNPNEGEFAPPWVGYLFIAFMGIAISGALSRSRMRITTTIYQAIQAGMAIQMRVHEEGRRRNDSAE